VRFNYNDNYYSHRHQACPSKGTLRWLNISWTIRVFPCIWVQEVVNSRNRKTAAEADEKTLIACEEAVDRSVQLLCSRMRPGDAIRRKVYRVMKVYGLLLSAIAAQTDSKFVRLLNT
jgi:hypothetical protein